MDPINSSELSSNIKLSSGKKPLVKFFAVTIILSLLSGAVSSLLVIAYAPQSLVNNLRSSNFVATVAQSETNKAKNEMNVVDVVQLASPAVVSIIVSKDLPKIDSNSMDPFYNDPFFRQFFGDNMMPAPDQNNSPGTQKQEIGGGSGFIVSSDGYVVTNKHVVFDDQADYTVLMNDEKKYDAKVVATDPTNDLAILKIDAKDLPTLKLGDSASIKLGQSVVAIGNALGEFRNTVSTGVISGLSRSVTAGGPGFAENLSGLIQTDAAINSGNSGGPLLDLNGEVIGVNTAMASGAQNIGFAIPINDLKSSIESVEKTGKIVRPFLGVRYILVNADIAKKNNLSVDYGALITRGTDQTELAVMPGSPADKSGLAENDIILEVDGQQVNAKNPLSTIIGKHQPNDEITLKIQHRGEMKTVKVTLTEFNNQ